MAQQAVTCHLDRCGESGWARACHADSRQGVRRLPRWRCAPIARAGPSVRRTLGNVGDSTARPLPCLATRTKLRRGGRAATNITPASDSRASCRTRGRSPVGVADVPRLAGLDERPRRRPDAGASRPKQERRRGRVHCRDTWSSSNPGASLASAQAPGTSRKAALIQASSGGRRGVPRCMDTSSQRVAAAFTNAAAGPARIARRRAPPPRPERARDQRRRWLLLAEAKQAPPRPAFRAVAVRRDRRETRSARNAGLISAPTFGYRLWLRIGKGVSG